MFFLLSCLMNISCTKQVSAAEQQQIIQSQKNRKEVLIKNYGDCVDQELGKLIDPSTAPETIAKVVWSRCKSKYKEYVEDQIAPRFNSLGINPVTTEIFLQGKVNEDGDDNVQAIVGIILDARKIANAHLNQ